MRVLGQNAAEAPTETKKKKHKIFVATISPLHTEPFVLREIQFGKSMIDNWPSLYQTKAECAASVAMKQRIKNRFG